jgi:ornithine decarboxylase
MASKDHEQIKNFRNRELENMDISELMGFLQEYHVKLFDEEKDIYDVIKSFLESNDSENAFYIVDLTRVMNQYYKWIEHLPRIKPHYAVKCNPNSVMIKMLSQLGCNFDCASKEEISQVLSLGVSPERIIFANPCKASSHIKYARSEDVDLLTFDNVSELYKIKLYHPRAKLLVRIKVDDSKSVCKFSCKFGASLDELDEIYQLAKASSLNICGVSYHIGSNCKDIETYEKAIIDAKKAFDIGANYGFKMNILDIGGGFVCDNDDDESECEEDMKCRSCSIDQKDVNIEVCQTYKFEDVCQVINRAIDTYFKNMEIDIIAEPGRFMVGNSHTLVLNIISKKEYINKDCGERTFRYYLNDGVYGSFNCIYFDHAKPQILPYNERDGKLYESTVFGQSCDSIDTCGTFLLPDLAIGETVFVKNFGAYTTAAATTFNGFSKTKSYYVMKK